MSCAIPNTARIIINIRQPTLKSFRTNANKRRSAKTPTTTHNPMGISTILVKIRSSSNLEIPSNY